jgi:hypothetical protein
VRLTQLPPFYKTTILPPCDIVSQPISTDDSFSTCPADSLHFSANARGRRHRATNLYKLLKDRELGRPFSKSLLLQRATIRALADFLTTHCSRMDSPKATELLKANLITAGKVFGINASLSNDQLTQVKSILKARHNIAKPMDKPLENCLINLFSQEQPVDFGRGSTMGNALVLTSLALVKAGADINIKDSPHGNTLLYLAARRGNAKIVKMLIEQSADVDVTNPHGMTPLHLAAWHGHPETVKLLIRAGANPLIKDTSREITAAGYARAFQQEQPVIVEMLEAAEKNHRF